MVAEVSCEVVRVFSSVPFTLSRLIRYIKDVVQVAESSSAPNIYDLMQSHHLHKHISLCPKFYVGLTAKEFCVHRHIPELLDLPRVPTPRVARGLRSVSTMWSFLRACA